MANKMTVSELRKLDIHQWDWIQKDFHKIKNAAPDLLIGNGFSLNFSTDFSYTNLFQKFLENVTSEHAEVFREFRTSNFELIMRQLNYTKRVNSILGLDPTGIVASIILELKEGLIKTINQIHPKSAETDWNKLNQVTKAFRNYGDVYSTNYDIFLYQIVMLSKDDKNNDNELIAYQDYFWGKCRWNDNYNEFMGRQDYIYKNVYYLHGALFIFKDGLNTLKLKKKRKELIESISDEIMKGEIPVFVSEGTTNEKKKTIDENPYLRFCFNKLNHSDTPILIYGHSLSDFDEHIVNTLINSKRKIVFAIYTPNRTEADLQKVKSDIITAFKLPRHDKSYLTFVDSESVFSFT